MKKIVILSERLPFPPTSGTKNLLYNYCKILHEKMGYEVISISFLEQDDAVELKPEFISKVYPLPNPRGSQKLRNLILKTFIQRKFPMQVSLFWDSNIKRLIDEIISSEKPDCVIADLIRSTEYLRDFSGYKLADMQDLFSLRYERQLQMDLESLNPYGAYLFRLPKFVRSILSLKFVKRMVMNIEIKLLKEYELQVGRIYDGVTFVAKRECEIYNQLLGDNKAFAVPLGVDYPYFSEKIATDIIPHSIAFMGALNVAHNENGIIHFINNIFPKILENVPDTKLYIIGGGATERLKRTIKDNVVLTGRVPDVRVAVSVCEVFICPLQFGSGIKTKNLEAMAMGKPVVTTSIGAENIDAVDGKEWHVADDDNEFAQKVITLMKDKELRDRIGTNAKAFVKKNFTWEVAEESLKEHLG